MMPAMNMPVMPQTAMMPGMGMPMMMPGMGMPMMPGMMMPNMMPGMMPNMMGMMPVMPAMMCRVTMELGKDGLTCKMVPLEGMTMDMLRERCEAMIKMMSAGVPLTMMCGPMMVTCAPGR